MNYTKCNADSGGFNIDMCLTLICEGFYSLRVITCLTPRYNKK
jgi:hypothetical protein